MGVDAEAGLFGVLSFQNEAAFEGDVVVAGNLPDASNAGFGLDDVLVVFAHVPFFVSEVWAVANDGHLANEDVDKLRSFVYREATNKTANFSDARIFF